MQTVFLDACAIIYWVEARSPWYERFQEALRLLQLQYGTIQLATSDLSRLECLVKPMREQQLDKLVLFEKLFAHPDLFIQTLSPDVIEKALKLRVMHKIKTPDALQAASAIIMDEQAVFMTADSGFNKIDNLNTVII